MLGAALAASCCTNQDTRPAAMTLDSLEALRQDHGGCPGPTVPHTWTTRTWCPDREIWIPLWGAPECVITETLVPL